MLWAHRGHRWQRSIGQYVGGTGGGHGPNRTFALLSRCRGRSPHTGLSLWTQNRVIGELVVCGDSVEEVGVLAVLMLSGKQASLVSLYAGDVSGTNFASLRRFWAVAASWNCSVAPLGPRSRIIRKPIYRLRWANNISTFRRWINEVM